MSGKEVKKTQQKSFYLYIYNYIKENKKLPTKNISKQKVNYYLKALKREGYVYKKGYGVWEIDPDKELKEVKKVNYVTSTNPKRTRGHGFVFQVLIKPIIGWENRETYLRNNNFPYSNIRQGQRITLRGHKIWLCDTSLVIYFSPKLSFYSRSSYQSSAEALIECKETIRKLEDLFKTSFKYGKGWFINESRSHYADVRNVMAKYYKSMGVNNFEVVQNGKVWALIDNSFNLYELETIAGGGDSKKDLPKLQMFLNDLRDNPTTFSQTKEEMLNLIHQLAKRTDEIQQQLMASIEVNKQLSEIILNKFNSE
jgi:hypothetical protein